MNVLLSTPLIIWVLTEVILWAETNCNIHCYRSRSLWLVLRHHSFLDLCPLVCIALIASDIFCISWQMCVCLVHSRTNIHFLLRKMSRIWLQKSKKKLFFSITVMNIKQGLLKWVFQLFRVSVTEIFLMIFENYSSFLVSIINFHPLNCFLESLSQVKNPCEVDAKTSFKNYLILQKILQASFSSDQIPFLRNTKYPNQ